MLNNALLLAIRSRDAASFCRWLEAGLKDPKFKEILETAQKELPEYGKDFSSYKDLIPADKRNNKNLKDFSPEKLKEAMALLEMMEKLKS